jgi:hypothetical protein
MNRYYNTGYPLLHLLLTPVMLRRPLLSALLVSLARPFEALHVDFRAYVQTLEVQVNAQVCYMQAALNDEFDYIKRRIGVRQAAPEDDASLLWREDRDRPVMICREGTPGYVPYMLGRDGQAGSGSVDFEIVIPTNMAFTVLEIRRLKALVNRNKLASKKYRIVYE